MREALFLLLWLVVFTGIPISCGLIEPIQEYMFKKESK